MTTDVSDTERPKSDIKEAAEEAFRFAKRCKDGVQNNVEDTEFWTNYRDDLIRDAGFFIARAARINAAIRAKQNQKLQ